MLLEKEFIERIRNINWFLNCGNPLKDNLGYEVVYEGNLKKAVKQSESKYWEEITHEARNNLTQYLFSNFPEKYKKWNNYTKEGREIIEEYVVPPIKDYIENKKISAAILNNVKMDILMAIMEYTYRLEREPAFFMELLKVYEAGNFPCGWKGSWPEGKLIVY